MTVRRQQLLSSNIKYIDYKMHDLINLGKIDTIQLHLTFKKL